MIKNILFQNVCSDIQAEERRETSAHEQAWDSCTGRVALCESPWMTTSGRATSYKPGNNPVIICTKRYGCIRNKHNFGTQPESIWSVFVLISLAPGIRKPRGWDWPFTLPQHAVSFPLLYLSLMRNEERALCLHLLYQSPPLWLCV